MSLQFLLFVDRDFPVVASTWLYVITISTIRRYDWLSPFPSRLYVITISTIRRYNHFKNNFKRLDVITISTIRRFQLTLERLQEGYMSLQFLLFVDKNNTDSRTRSYMSLILVMIECMIIVLWQQEKST